jgi:thiamine biosynthesis lipoprotein
MKKITLILFLLTIAGCRQSVAPTLLEGFTQGTTYRIIIRDRVKPEIQNDIDSLFRQIEASMSLYNPNSLISRLNRNETDSLDSYITDCIRLSLAFSRETDGLFDITVGPLTAAYGFGGKTPVEHPNIDSLLQQVGYGKIRIENGRLIKDDPHVQIDLNAVAQGYTVDLVARHFDSLGLKNYLIEMGGELFSRGVRADGEPWRVGIDAPVEGNFTPGAEIQATLGLSGRGMATSGNYRKFREDTSGHKIVHTIDPRNGQPVISNVLSATVLAPDAAQADLIGTYIMAAGLEQATQFLGRHPETDAYIIYTGENGEIQTFSTSGLAIVELP